MIDTITNIVNNGISLLFLFGVLVWRLSALNSKVTHLDSSHKEIKEKIDYLILHYDLRKTIKS